MSGNTVYEERISSRRTEALFILLASLFLMRWEQRKRRGRAGRLSALFLGLGVLFLFYILNYHTLHIRLTPDSVQLRFGIFSWTIPMDSIERCHLDKTSLWRIGGAGIHFSWFERRYRAMFNFLEYPRVIVALKEKRGPVRDVAFSTQHPQQVMNFIREASGAKGSFEGTGLTKEDGDVRPG